MTTTLIDTIVRVNNDLPDATAPLVLSTAGWPYDLHAEWVAGGMCQAKFAHVPVNDLPKTVRKLLRDLGCGPWLDGADERDTVALGEAVCVPDPQGPLGYKYAPPPTIPVAELVAKVKAGPTPQQRREQEQQEERERQDREAEARRLEQEETDRNIAAKRQEDAKDAEAHRRLDPRYCLRKMEELAAKVLGTKQE
jgi:hypothetical protein